MTELLYAFLFFMFAASPAHLTLLHFIFLILFGDESLLGKFLSMQFSVASC
jgi:hypothetical protein